MKYSWKRALSAIVAFMLILSMTPATPITAQAASENDLTFELNADRVSYSVVDCIESASGALTIPAAYNGKPVTSIGMYAFASCKSLTSVTISEGVIRIDDYAFYSCSGLTDITIPDSVTSIGVQAFYSCTALTSISIPDSITSIGYSAFSSCTNLNYNTYNQAKFLGNDTNPYVALMTADSSIQSCSVPNGTKLIATDAFQNCSSLTSVTLPDSVTHIGVRAFYYCTNLTSITLGNSVADIGESAFNYCTSLTSIAIPASVTSIGSAAFSGCDALDAVYITDIAAWCNIAFDDAGANPLFWSGRLYLNGELVTDPVIPDHVTIIRDYAFYDYYGLNSITIPSSITTIGNSAFYYCHRLKAVHITDIAAWCNIAFYNHSTNPLYYAGKLYLNGELVTDLVIPDYVTGIGNYAFYDYDQLTSITIPKSVKKIGTNAFAKCDALAHIWYYGSENDAKSITGTKPSGTWHYNYCGADNHNYDNPCDSVCNICDYPRDVSHVYDDADDLTCNACKQTLAPAAPSYWDSLVTDTTVTLPAIYGYEYSMDAITWQTSNVFTGLQPATSYDFYQRVAASADNLVSPASSPTTIKTRKYTPAAPDVPVLEAKTSTTVTLQTQSGYEYSKDGYTWQTSNQFTGLMPETQYTFYQRTAETNTDYASASSAPITVTTLRAFTVTYDTLGGSVAPAAQLKDQGIALVLSSTVPTYSSYLFKGWSTSPYGEVAYSGGDTYTKDENITLYAVFAQRCYTCSGTGDVSVPCSLCNGSGTWWGMISTCCYARTAYVQINHGSSYYMCRSCGKACDVVQGGADCETTQKSVCESCSGNGYLKRTPPAPSQPELLNATSSSITIVPQPGMEYSLDGITWQIGNTFRSLSPNTRYTICQRYKESTYYNASAASEALPVTTQKNTHSTPAAPTLSSKTTTQVVLVVVPGCEYSRDGVNWQRENVFEDLEPSTQYVFYQRKCEDAQNYASAPSAGLSVRTDDLRYTVVFKDWDGTELSCETYYWGEEVFASVIPTRDPDDTYTYTFAGWDKPVINCAGDATYTATYMAQKHVALVGVGDEQFGYPTISIALTNAPANSTLQLLCDIEEDVVIFQDLVFDLNGFNVTGDVSVTSGAKFFVKDSQTDDYTIWDGSGYGKLKGKVTGVQAEDGYIMIAEPDGVSFHLVDLQMTDMTLRASAVGVYYKCNFAGDEIVAQHVDRYGVALSVAGEPTADAPGICSWYDSFIPGNGGNAVNGTLLQGIMKTTNTESVNAENAEIAIYGRAYILTKDGQYIFGECVNRSFREQVELVDAQWHELTTEQQLAVLNMYKSYESVIGKWDIPNILAAM